MVFENYCQIFQFNVEYLIFLGTNKILGTSDRGKLIDEIDKLNPKRSSK